MSLRQIIMRIERVSHLKSCGIFRDFTWAGDLKNFDRFNLIYGWNGTGKSTISRIFRDLEHKREPEFGEVGLMIDGRRVSGRAFPSQDSSVRVFNRDYVDDTVLPREGAEAPPIYVVGSENVEKQRRVDQLKSELDAALVSKRREDDRRSNASSALDRHGQEHAKAIKEQLRSTAAHAYNDYNKGAYFRAVQSVALEAEPSVHHMGDAEFDAARTQQQATPRPLIEPLNYTFPDLGVLTAGVTALLDRTVASAGIAALREDAELVHWLREGHDLHQTRGSSTCLYCDQQVPKERVAALNAHFNAEHRQLESDIERTQGDLLRMRREAESLVLPAPGQLYDDLTVEYDSARGLLLEVLGLIAQALRSFIDGLEGKKTKLYEAVPFAPELPAFDVEVLARVNAAVATHNRATEDFESRASTARERIAAHMLAETLGAYQALVKEQTRAQEAWSAADEKCNVITGEIRTLETQIVEHRQPAEDLNRELAAYLGHNELHFEVSHTGYAISRPDGPAFRLSEGERTAIALLYFMKSLTDRGFELSKGIVVLDDPVSSMDANALFLAFGIIRRRLDEAGQVFIFTHNFTLFREVRNWFQHQLKGVDKKSARFYMLECSLVDGSRASSIARLDPLLEDYKSEYHYLFATVSRAAATTTGSTLGANYQLPNMARRLLETFLEFRFPDSSQNLHTKVERIEFDETKRTRVLSFLNAFSHGNEIDDGDHDLSLLAEAPQVLADLIAMMAVEDPKHVHAMQGSIKTGATGGGQ